MIDVILKKDMSVCFEDLQDGEGLKTLLLKAGDIVPVDMVTNSLVDEFEIFKPYLNQYFIDIDKLFGNQQIVIEDIEQLILARDDWKFDEAKVEKDFQELKEYYGIDKKTEEEKQAILDEWNESVKNMPKPNNDTLKEIAKSLYQYVFDNARKD